MSGKVGWLGPLASFALKYPKTAATAVSVGGSMKSATAALSTALSATVKTAADSTPVTFFLAHWKAILITLAIVIACVSAFIWIKHDEAVHYNRGYNASQTKYVAALQAANKRAATDQAALDVLKQKYADLSHERQQQVEIVTQPKIERIVRETQSTPVYSSCTLTDSVFNDLTSEAAGVNASIDSARP